MRYKIELSTVDGHNEWFPAPEPGPTLRGGRVVIHQQETGGSGFVPILALETRLREEEVEHNKKKGELGLRTKVPLVIGAVGAFDAEPDLVIRMRADGSLVQLAIGRANLIDNGRVSLRSMQVAPQVSYRRDFFRTISPSESSIWIPASLGPPLRVSFVKVDGQDYYVPAFSWQRDVSNEGNLKAFGTEFFLKLDNKPVTVTQFPAELMKPVVPESTTREWRIAIGGLPFEFGERVWTELARRLAMGDRFATSEASASFLPWFRFSDGEEKSDFAGDFDLVYFLPNRKKERLSINKRNLAGPDGARWDILYRFEEEVGNGKVLQPQTEALWARPADEAKSDTPPAAWIEIPRILDHRGKKLGLYFPIGNRADMGPDSDGFGAIRDAMRYPGIGMFQHDRFALWGGAEGDFKNSPFRIGSLDVGLGTTAWPVSEENHRRVRLVLGPTGHAKDVSLEDLRITVALEHARPGGQDEIPGALEGVCGDEEAREGDRAREGDSPEPEIECSFLRERPVVIPLENKDEPRVKLLLKIEESAKPGDRRRVDLRLFRVPGETGPPAAGGGAGASGDEFPAVCEESSGRRDQVVVLDRVPFLVAKVTFPALGAPSNDAVSTEVANWANYGHDAGTWRVRFPNAEAFCLTLPPQGVGETMEKYRTFGDIAKKADFRLAPPAYLALRERYYRENFPEAPWNLRRLLEDPGRELPGAQLEHLQFELLYGLSCRLDYGFVRLAELSALVGEAVGPLPRRPAWAPFLEGDEADKAFDKVRLRWAQTYRSLGQRLGLFELWDLSRLDTLHLKEGVACWIRSTRDQQAQAPTDKPPELLAVQDAQVANPFDRCEDWSSKAPQGGSPGDARLCGGAIWGFEARNVYNAVMSPEKKWPRSSGAEVADLRLSALGGYGRQMAAFDYWRTKILADTAMGRTYSYTLERIGRIAVWWNRAKHVIVYERTVLPSRQELYDPKDQHERQHRLAGRAVLRKVAEYVEILQNKRPYPDRDGGDTRATGCVTACVFSEDPNQVVRFAVDSGWGRDIGTTGWKVPLWTAGAKPKDVYPKPVVNLEMMASVEGESTPRKQTIADPENLFFYTDTTPPKVPGDPTQDLSNTDKWPPVEGVDFVDEARPVARQEPAFRNGQLRQRSPGDSQLPVGLRPCTFLLEPAEHAADLIAFRGSARDAKQPLGAFLSSVTLCRARLEQATAGLAQDFSQLRSAIADDFVAKLEELPAEAGRFDPQAFQIKIQNELNTGLCQKVKEAAGALDGSLDEGRNRLKTIAQDVPAMIEKLDEQAVARITSEAERAFSYPERLLSTAFAEKSKLKEAVAAEVDDARARLLGLSSPAVYLTSVDAALQDAQLTLQDGQDALKAVKKALSEITSPSGRIDPTKLDGLTAKLRSYLAALRSILSRLHTLAETSPALEEPTKKTKLSAGLGARWVIKKLNLETLEKDAADVQDAIAAAEQLARESSQRVQDLLQRRLNAIDAHLSRLTTALGDATKKRQVLQTKIDGAQEARRAFIAQVADQVKAAAASTIDELWEKQEQLKGGGLARAWTKAVEGEVRARADELRAGVKKIRDGAQDFYKDADGLIPRGIASVVEAQCKSTSERLLGVLKDLGDKFGVEEKLAEVRAVLERHRDEALRQVDEKLSEGVRTARQLIRQVEPKGQDALNLVRAFGKPPEVSGIKFDRPETAFFFNELDDRIHITPVIARAAQVSAVADALKPFGVDLPVEELGKKLIPATLENFDLASIFPNIAGIPLQNLFSGLKMPSGSADGVKIEHGADPQTRRAWVRASVDVQAATATLFALGPLAIRVREPRFEAQARVEIDERGAQQRLVDGKLTGDWKMEVGGFELITFLKTPLSFDQSGRINFAVEPKNVQLAEALSFINELMATLSPGGLSTRFDGDGVVATLSLPIPDTQLGAFGFSGLCLGASLALRYGKAGFSIGVGASLARRDAPFTLTIFILGGAGYIELGARYFPATGLVTSYADMAIAASASLAIALGPISGGVAVYVGVTASYDSARGGGLTVGLMFMVRGYVSVLAIASANITLRLDGLYQDGALVGTGSLQIKIKICWCFTLEVNESVTYTLGRVGSASQKTGLYGPKPVARLARLGALSAIDDGGSPGGERKLDADELIRRIDEYIDLLA
ncbi:MAG TPA: hypothetical protein VHQ90_19315 [Thermoanaerobaculia bacterium]|nr:hypothetical protein [Thermoanaerobaculia bacterium]